MLNDSAFKNQNAIPDAKNLLPNFNSKSKFVFKLPVKVKEQKNKNGRNLETSDYDHFLIKELIYYCAAKRFNLTIAAASSRRVIGRF